MLKSLFSSKGRINRIKFLLAYVVSILVVLILSSIFDQISYAAEASGGSMLFSPGFWIGSTLSILNSFTFLWIVIALTIKRCHDIGWSAWASLFILVPVLGFLLFVFYPGQAVSNQYGEPPK
jgi:uncharacterized membrane protein YhaH (DUF805 family)